jgi:hypothetical protein
VETVAVVVVAMVAVLLLPLTVAGAVVRERVAAAVVV